MNAASAPRPPLLHRLAASYLRRVRHRGKDRAVSWWARTFRPAPIVARTDFGAWMSLELNDWVQYLILRNGAYEPGTIALLRRLLRPGGCFVDVGGNVGQHTLAAAGVVGPAGRVVVLEPSPQVFPQLLRNLALNELRQVEPVLAAASNRSGLIRLCLVPEDNLGTGGEATTDDAAGYTAPVVELGPLLESLQVPPVDVVKIDVEGQEQKVLEGLFRTPRYRPTHLLVELRPDTPQYGLRPEDLLALLRAEGYALATIHGQPYELGRELPEHNLWATREGGRLE
jgi:FkbM family methyltransferase